MPAPKPKTMNLNETSFLDAKNPFMKKTTKNLKAKNVPMHRDTTHHETKGHEE